MFKALQGLDYRKEGNNAPYFSRHVEHHGYNRRVIVAVDDDAHVAEFPAEVGGVLRKLSDPFNTWRTQVRKGQRHNMLIKFISVSQLSTRPQAI